MRTFLALLYVALLTAACASAGRGSAEGSAAVPVAGADAAIQPGDRIALRIWNEPEMSDTFTVAETGEVVLPNLGSVAVTGRSAGELQRSLREDYAEYLRNPSVAVTVLRRIGVHGEVRQPDLYLVDLTMTLRDVIAMAGGVTEYGDPQDIRVVRDGAPVVMGGVERPAVTTIELRSGDQVIVGRRSWFELNSLAIATTAAIVASTVIPLLRSIF